MVTILRMLFGSRRAIPFEWTPPALALLLFVFISSASLASRFDRLTDAEKNVNYTRQIGHLVEINPHCAKYGELESQQDRPFTRLDLDVRNRALIIKNALDPLQYSLQQYSYRN